MCDRQLPPEKLKVHGKVNVLSTMALFEAGGRMVKAIMNHDMQREALKLEQKAKARLSKTASLVKNAAAKTADVTKEAALLAKEGAHLAPLPLSPLRVTPRSPL
jgi:hypothetical protein